MIKTKEQKLLIKPSDINPSGKEFEVIAVINPAAIRLPNNDIILYARVIEKLIKDENEKHYYSPRMIGKEKFKIKLDRFNKKLVKEKNRLDFVLKDGTKRLTFISHLRKVVLDRTGFKIKRIEKKPSFYGLSWDGELGIEDPRITKINDLYVMSYVSLSRNENVSTSYAISNDCINWYRRGVIFSEQNKDVALFPERINEKYIALNRPEGSFEFSSPHIWLSYSKDLEHWGEASSLRLSKKSSWDSGRVGTGPPPIKTEKGWLLLYHGVIEPKEESGFIKKLKEVFYHKEKRIKYAVGAALLDLKNPKKIIAKSQVPIITPRMKYEKGTFEDKDVVFPTGLILDKNDLLIYSGGGDVVTTVKKISLTEILNSLKNIKKNFV